MQYDVSEIMRLAQSPAGQSLIALLQRTDGVQLQKAISKASGGDLDGARNAISCLLTDPQIQELLKQLEESQ